MWDEWWWLYVLNTNIQSWVFVCLFVTNKLVTLTFYPTYVFWSALVHNSPVLTVHWEVPLWLSYQAKCTISNPKLVHFTFGHAFKGDKNRKLKLETKDVTFDFCIIDSRMLSNRLLTDSWTLVLHYGSEKVTRTNQRFTRRHTLLTYILLTYCLCYHMSASAYIFVVTCWDRWGSVALGTNLALALGLSAAPKNQHFKAVK